MIYTGSRTDAENSLAGALARQIGYTSAAYSLPRILSVLEFFRDRPSGYKQELLAFLKSHQAETEGSEGYLEEVINFAVAMKLVEVVSSSHATLQRLAPTETGRSVSGALASGDENFARYYIARTVLIADADYSFPVLKYCAAKPDVDVKNYFLDFQHNLRLRRHEWLRQIFPDRVLFSRIADSVGWLRKGKGLLADYEAERLTLNTARHHTTPRLGWLSYLGLIEGERRITALGRDLVAALEGRKHYFWLGPPSGVQEALRIPPDKCMHGPFEDTFTLSALESSPPTAADVANLIDRLAHIMSVGYAAAKLIHAPQASLVLSIEFIRYTGYIEQKDYQWETVLDEFFTVKKSEFERFSAKRGQIGFYRPKGNAEQT
ncbi:hypothetical protein GFM11_33510 [Rhizobium leguminosarum bv. viciae]|uniref:hypothetical protein n=1 Tax=Rhizobium leguminosarum TaxID=384 RepID=UPI0014429701|nr:hypothetical protein [Rhizobium leguminosarum]NKK18075.1 hypothetical protein [Rhizobium leguminosarum bv. viciae]